jgi:hypothetical protein
LIRHPPLPVAATFPQPIQLRHRHFRQTLKFRLPEFIEAPLQDFLCGRPAQRFVQGIHHRQHVDILSRVSLGEAIAAIRFRLHLLALHVPGNQACGLRPAQPRHLLHITPQQSPAASLQVLVALLSQRLVHPAVYLLSMTALKFHSIAGLHKRPDLLQAQLFYYPHADDHPPA